MSNSHYNTENLKDSKDVVKLEECTQYVVDCWQDWDSHWSAKFSEFERLYDQWIGKPPKREEEWQSQFHKRLSWQAEKTLVSRYHSALFPTSAPIDYDATEVTDDFSGILAKSLVAHWFKIGLISKEFLSGMRSAAIYGTGLFEDEWYVKTEEVPVEEEYFEPEYKPMVDIDGAIITDSNGNVKSLQVGERRMTRTVFKNRITDDRYKVKKANLFSWRVHPHKLTDEDDYPAIKQEFVTYNELLDRQKSFQQAGMEVYENLDKLEKDVTSQNEEDVKRLQKDGDYKDDKDPRIELLHFWGLYKDEKEDKKRPVRIIVANRKYKIKKADNPFWHKKPPLFHINWTEDEKPSYYGIGVVQIGKDAEDRANLNVNIRNDIKKKNLRQTGWYNALDKKIKKKHLEENYPGLMRPCTDINNAAKLDMPIPLLPEDYKEEEMAVYDHREITGATTALLPAADKREMHSTLGGMQIMQAQSIARLKPDLVMMELMGIRQIANRAFLLTRQFFKKEKAIELIASESELKKFGISNKIYTLTPDQILQKVNFFCTGLSESVDKMQNIDKLIKFAEISSKIPPLQMIVNYEGIGKKIALLLGFEDISDFIRMDMNNPLISMQNQMPMQGQPGQVPGQPPGMGGQQGLPPEIIQRIQQGLMAQRQQAQPGVNLPMQAPQ